MLRSGEADFRDDSEASLGLGGTSGLWRGALWWELSSGGELRVLEQEGGKLVSAVRLEHVQSVGRTRGNDFYEYCIDIDVEAGGEEERTVTLRPPGRAAMAAWLGALKEQLEMHRPQPADAEEGGSLTVQLGGWMRLTRQDLNHTVGRKFFQLVTEQRAVAEQTVVMHTLYWFDAEVRIRLHVYIGTCAHGTWHVAHGAGRMAQWIRHRARGTWHMAHGAWHRHMA